MIKPKLYLIITNISKSNNIQSLMLAAVAYGVDTVFVAGQRKFNFSINETCNDDKRKKSDLPRQIHPLIKSGKLKIVKFDCLEDCIDHLKNKNRNELEKGSSQLVSNNYNSLPIRIVGVEIVSEAKDVNDEPFNEIEHTALMMGNEGSGMNQKQMDACDDFIRIAQYGSGTASLNVNVAANIVMHRFQIWSLNLS